MKEAVRGAQQQYGEQGQCGPPQGVPALPPTPFGQGRGGWAAVCGSELAVGASLGPDDDVTATHLPHPPWCPSQETILWATATVG